MPLTSVVVDEKLITPRGGPAGTNVSVPGAGFGVQPGSPPGQIRVDPLGENVLAVVVSWAPNLVVFTAPALAQVNRIVDITIELAGLVDSYTFPFWYPSLTSPTVDYQWPNAEAGSPGENEDDPRIFTAADFNRMLDRFTSGSLPPVVPRQYAVLQENPAGTRLMALLPDVGLIGGYRAVADIAARDAIPADMRTLGMLVRAHSVDKIYVLKTGLTNADWVELTTGGGGGGDITDNFTGSVIDGQTIFTLSVNPDPARLSSVKFFINGVKYTKDHGAFTIGGVGNRTITWIVSRPTLKATDKVEADYPPE